MSALSRRLRSLVIALAVLTLSATAVLAGRSALAAPTAPAVTAPDDSDAQGDEVETDVDETGVDETGVDTTDADAPDEDAGADLEPSVAGAPDQTADHPDNHGADVSEAARGDTPDGAKNHGEAVRVVAKDNGHDDGQGDDAETESDHHESKPAEHAGTDHHSSHSSDGAHHDDDEGDD
jgi:hypothetical protein